jgi:hypothetical protein
LVQPGWIAEHPETHLLPHLARACQVAHSPWVLQGTAWQENGVFLVTLTWSGSGPLRALRRDVFALIGEIAEATTHVRQTVHDDMLEYRVTTGMLSGDSPFSGHGHLVTFEVEGPDVPAIIAGLTGHTDGP